MSSEPGSGAAAPVAPQAPWHERHVGTTGCWEWEQYVIYRHGGGEGPVDGYFVFHGANQIHKAVTLDEAKVVAERHEVSLIHKQRHELSVEDERLRQKLSMLKGRDVP